MSREILNFPQQRSQYFTPRPPPHLYWTPDYLEISNPPIICSVTDKELSVFLYWGPWGWRKLCKSISKYQMIFLFYILYLKYVEVKSFYCSSCLMAFSYFSGSRGSTSSFKNTGRYNISKLFGCKWFLLFATLLKITTSQVFFKDFAEIMIFHFLPTF